MRKSKILKARKLENNPGFESALIFFFYHVQCDPIFW